MKSHSESSEKWSKEQLLYMEWESLPKSERKPKTIEEFSKQLGITSRTIRNWKQLPGFWDGVRNEGRANLRASVSRLYRALINEAEGGSYQHLKLALEMLGEHTDRIQHVTWKDEVINLIKNGMADYQSVVEELGEDLAQELFELANISQ